MYYVNLYNQMPLGYYSLDPELQSILQATYEARDRFLVWYQTHQRDYNYPPPRWDAPETFTVQGDRRRTWEKL